MLEPLLQKSAEFKSGSGKSRAEAALQTTKAVITTMRSGGSEDTDELLKLMVAMYKQQQVEATKLFDKSPSRCDERPCCR